MMTLGLSMIVKNVSDSIRSCLRSVAPYVHEIIIVDTGSTDTTKTEINDVIAQCNPSVKPLILDFNQRTHPEAFLHDSTGTWQGTEIGPPYTNDWFLADFGGARNFGWERLSTDYVIWLDSDDVLEHGEKLGNIIVDMATNKIDTAFLNYDYAHDGQGNPTCKLLRERIIRRSLGAKWMQPIHEVVGPVGLARPYSEANVVHHRDKYPSQNPLANRNLKVLTKWFAKQKSLEEADARMIFYLAMEERFVTPEKAIEHFKIYVRKSGWDEERAVAHLLAGRIHEGNAHYFEAFEHYCQAVVEHEPNPDGYFSAARTAYHRQDWGKCAEWTERAFKVVKEHGARESVLMHDPLDRTYRPYIFYSVALINLGRLTEAVEACDKGLAINPNDPHLNPNKQFALSQLKEKTVPNQPAGVSLKFDTKEPLDTRSMDMPNDLLVAFAIQLWKKDMENDQVVEALNLLNALPPTVYGHPRIEEARRISEGKLIRKPSENTSVAPVIIGVAESHRPSKALDIILFTGPGWETWTPFSIETGIGGSETAAIAMSRELVKLGHRVRLIGECQGKEATYEGVEYIDHRHLMDKRVAYNCDVLISSRAPWVFDFPITAKKKFLWVHDIHVGQPTPVLDRQLGAADKIFCLSEWHKLYFLQTYPSLSPDKIIVTRNGIDIERFKVEPLKRGNRLHWSSSPDRGLDRLIELLPEIRKEVPDAEVHVFYGFENWEKMAAAFNGPIEVNRVKSFKNLILSMSNRGVIYHGRVGQKELADSIMASKVWAYPTWFTETSCITAMECQAGGCVPVSTALAALNETVRFGYLLRPPNTTPVYGNEFVKKVVELLKNEPERQKIAEAGRQFALNNFSWSSVASEWQSIFKESMGLLTSAKETVVSSPKPSSKIELPTFSE